MTAFAAVMASTTLTGMTLIRCVAAYSSSRMHAYWAAIAGWLRADRRFARLVSAYDGPPIDLLPVGTEFQFARRGEDVRFAGSALRVPAGTLRDRADDVVRPEVLVQRHVGYRNRVRMGANWRADVWKVLERAPEISAAEVACPAGCSLTPAWQVVQDFALLRAATNASASSSG